MPVDEEVKEGSTSDSKDTFEVEIDPEVPGKNAKDEKVPGNQGKEVHEMFRNLADEGTILQLRESNEVRPLNLSRKYLVVILVISSLILCRSYPL